MVENRPSDEEKKKPKAAPADETELVERIFYEHISYIYPTIIVSVVIVLIIIAAAVVTKIWPLLALSLILALPIYLKTRRRNRFLITNRRFIRVLSNPKSGTIDVPLNEIVEAKVLSRRTDPKGTVHVYTTPAYGEQILVDNENEVGVIACSKVAGHGDLAEVLMDFVRKAKYGE